MCMTAHRLTVGCVYNRELVLSDISVGCDDFCRSTTLWTIGFSFGCAIVDDLACDLGYVGIHALFMHEMSTDQTCTHVTMDKSVHAYAACINITVEHVVLYFAASLVLCCERRSQFAISVSFGGISGCFQMCGYLEVIINWYIIGSCYRVTLVSLTLYSFVHYF